MAPVSPPNSARPVPISRKQLAARLLELPPFPAVARKLLALLGQPRFTIPEVSQVIRADAVFSGEVLRLANSAMMGLRYEVVSIMHAISVLGVDKLRGLVLTVAMRDFLKSNQSDLMKQSWRHNLSTALFAEALAEPCGIEASDAYSAGLMHDIGRLALIAAFPAQYAAALNAFAASAAGQPWSEEAHLGIGYEDAGRLVADAWGLPSVLRAVIATPRPAPGGQFSIPCLIYAASGLSERLGFTIEPKPPDWSDDWARENLPQAAWPAIAPRLANCRESIPTRINLFECEFR